MTDVFLQSLVSIVNSNKVSFSITLTVDGAVLTGTLVSAKEFFDNFAASFSNAWPGGPHEGLREGFEQWGNVPEGAPDPHEDFIHLKDARYVSGKEMVPSLGTGVVWRGNLNSVSGFSLGVLA